MRRPQNGDTAASRQWRIAGWGTVAVPLLLARYPTGDIVNPVLVRMQVDLDTVRTELRRTASATTQPTTASVGLVDTEAAR